MYTKRIINKVPGHIPAESNKEKQGYIGDLSQKTIPQLNELLERQQKLLSQKAFINKLADKGIRIMKLKETIEEELKKRNDGDNLSRMLSALSMNGKEDLDALEWTGRCAPGHIAPDEEVNLSDDEQDPLKILATHSGAGFHKKKLRVIKPEEPLIRPSDLKTDDREREGEDLEEYAKHLCEKYDSVKTISNTKTKFFPFKTLKPSTSEKKDKKRMAKGWEVTAATPPPSVHGDTKLVSLHESLQLQCEQQLKLKEIQMKHAAERLAESQGFSVGQLPLLAGSYRDPASESSSDDEQSEHEVYDEEHPDGGGVTIYNIVDDVGNDV